MAAVPVLGHPRRQIPKWAHPTLFISGVGCAVCGHGKGYSSPHLPTSARNICERMCSLSLVEGSGGLLILPLLSWQFWRARTSSSQYVHPLHGLTLQDALSQSYLEEAFI